MIDLAGPQNQESNGNLPMVPGQYLVKIGPNILSFSSQAMDGNNNGVPGEATDAFQGSFSIDGSGRG